MTARSVDQSLSILTTLCHQVSYSQRKKGPGALQNVLVADSGSFEVTAGWRASLKKFDVSLSCEGREPTLWTDPPCKESERNVECS